MIYLPWVGLKSISSVKGTEEHHANQWYERQASRMAKKYFVPKYNVEWNESENPTYLIP